jgi:hypothetical protein
MKEMPESVRRWGTPLSPLFCLLFLTEVPLTVQPGQRTLSNRPELEQSTVDMGDDRICARWCVRFVLVLDLWINQVHVCGSQDTVAADSASAPSRVTRDGICAATKAPSSTDVHACAYACMHIRSSELKNAIPRSRLCLCAWMRERR